MRCKAKAEWRIFVSEKCGFNFINNIKIENQEFYYYKLNKSEWESKRKMEKYTCPICGYPDLDEPPRGIDGEIPSFDICDCCGIQFGYEDTNESNILKYRNKWIESGTEWFCKGLRPVNWSITEQLKNIVNDSNG